MCCSFPFLMKRRMRENGSLVRYMSSRFGARPMRTGAVAERRECRVFDELRELRVGAVDVDARETIRAQADARSVDRPATHVGDRRLVSTPVVARPQSVVETSARSFADARG
jgi:hypothetical protein